MHVYIVPPATLCVYECACFFAMSPIESLLRLAYQHNDDTVYFYCSGTKNHPLLIFFQEGYRRHRRRRRCRCG